ncbi:MAG: hypothetical protein PHQ88_03910 [Bacteroides sp.]|nr:hypothetical protein [Bacteroides sp.]MDD4719992.1 hypothetical protein [Bacteroides sp.]
MKEHTEYLESVRKTQTSGYYKLPHLFQIVQSIHFEFKTVYPSLSSNCILKMHTNESSQRKV